MSHQPERKEKNCLNCGTIVQGRFCHTCGQENIVTKDSFWGMFRHFVEDLVHFDGKFFTTLSALFIRPGFVPAQYVAGRRGSFVNPVRMYLFTSAIFFLIFFSLKTTEEIKIKDDRPFTKTERKKLLDRYYKKLERNPKDAQLLHSINLLKDSTKRVTDRDLTPNDDTTAFFTNTTFSTIEEYEVAQEKLAPAKRDNWLERLVAKREIQINEKYAGRSQQVTQDLFNDFLHRFPYMLFLSLPFFALILKLLYVRKKEFYYSDHSVFTLYHYIISFMLMLLVFFCNELEDWLGWNIFSYIITGIIIWWHIYQYKSMRRFYGQGGGKTFLKFVLLNILAMVLILFIFLGFLLFSMFQL